MTLLYTLRAKKDLSLTIDWYNQQQQGLGLDFLNCIESAVIVLQKNPKIYQKVYLNYRACLIKRFPFTLFYTLETQNIIIHAVFDNRQNPANRP